MQGHDVLHVLTRRPVVLGALAQAFVLGGYLAWVETPGSGLLIAGLFGGAVAGTLVGDVGDGWVYGPLASIGGLVAFGAGYVAYGGYLSWRLGTELLVRSHVQFVTALSLWGIPAYLILGAVAGGVIAYPAAAVRRRLRASTS